MSTLLDGQQTASTSPSITILVLQGMGGCGKTQLALKYCNLALQVEEIENGKREGGQDESDETEKGKNEKEEDGKSKAERRKPKIIVWIDATSPETAMLSFTKIAEAMSKPNFEPTDTEANLQYVRKSLDKTSKKWLLVFDNYDDPSSFQRKRIKEFFPSTGPGSILITSRHAEARTLAQGHKCLDVTRLSEEEALNLLLIRAERNTPEQDLTEAEKIVKRLGYHALAIDQAGAYIRSLNLDFHLYLMEYDQERQRLLNEAPDDWDYIKPSEDGTEEKVNYTVFTTLQLSLKLLGGDAQARMDKEHILTLMAFFDINNLRDAIFVPYGAENETWMASCQDSDDWNNHLFRKSLSELHNLSLLQNLDTNSSGASFTIHPLVQDWLKARIGKEQAKQYFIESMLVLSKYLWANGASDTFGHADFHAKQFMLAHVDATILAKQEFYDSWSFLQGSSLLKAGYAYYSILARQGRYHQAAELCGAVLAGWTNESGEEHPNALAAMHNLSNHLVYQGKYDKAEPLLRKCVAIDIKVHGKESLETLLSMDALTNLLIMQKKYEEADSTSEEAMEVSVRVLGRDHIDTISIIKHRAEVLRHLGNHSEAASMNKENLEMSKRVLGIQHPQTLAIMNNLALCLGEMERHKEAETFLREALSLNEKIHGPNHPETLTAIHNLAVNLYMQAKLTDAEELFWRAYPGYEIVYGWQHSSSINFLGWMAACLGDLGKYEEAERIINLMPASERDWHIQRLEKRKSRMPVGN